VIGTRITITLEVDSPEEVASLAKALEKLSKDLGKKRQTDRAGSRTKKHTRTSKTRRSDTQKSNPPNTENPSPAIPSDPSLPSFVQGNPWIEAIAKRYGRV